MQPLGDQSPEPLPCPVCGAIPDILRGLTSRNQHPEPAGSVQYTSVRCSNSGCLLWRHDISTRAELCLDDQDAVELWNEEVQTIIASKSTEMDPPDDLS